MRYTGLPGPAGGIPGKQGLDLVPVGSQLSGIDGVVQAHHQLISPGRVRLHHMGRGGIDDGAFLVEEDDPVQTVRVAGTVDLFDALACCSAAWADASSRWICRIPARF